VNINLDEALQHTQSVLHNFSEKPFSFADVLKNDTDEMYAILDEHQKKISVSLADFNNSLRQSK